MIRRTSNPPRRVDRDPSARKGRKTAQLPAAAPTLQSKAALVTSLLSRPAGASLDELVAATCWQPHTTRATLSGLRKKGHVLTKAKVEGVTRYTLEPAPLVPQTRPSAKKGVRS